MHGIPQTPAFKNTFDKNTILDKKPKYLTK